MRTTTANDLGAELDLSELLETSGSSLGAVPGPSRSVYGQSLLTETAPPAAAAASDGEAAWHMMTRPIRVERDDRSERPAAPAARPAAYDGDVEPGLAALCRGAGIDPRTLPPEARAAALQLAGQLLRESILGLMELQQGRSELRNRLGVGVAGADGARARRWTWRRAACRRSSYGCCRVSRRAPAPSKRCATSSAN